MIATVKGKVVGVREWDWTNPKETDLAKRVVHFRFVDLLQPQSGRSSAAVVEVRLTNGSVAPALGKDVEIICSFRAYVGKSGARLGCEAEEK